MPGPGSKKTAPFVPEDRGRLLETGCPRLGSTGCRRFRRPGSLRGRRVVPFRTPLTLQEAKLFQAQPGKSTQFTQKNKIKKERKGKETPVPSPRVTHFCRTSPGPARLRVSDVPPSPAHTFGSPSSQKPPRPLGRRSVSVPQAAPLRPRAAAPQERLPFSKKLITVSVPAAAARPGPAEGAPTGDRAAESEGEPLSPLRWSRFLLFLEDMLRTPLESERSKAGSTCALRGGKNFRGRSQRGSAPAP